MTTTADMETILKYHATFDPDLREKIIVEHLPLVHYTLGKLGISKDLGPEYEDMASQGILGLIDALDRFDTEQGTQFSTYATIRIRGKILDYMRSLDWLSRTARKRTKDVKEAIDTFWSKKQRLPSDVELAESLDMELDEVRTALVDSSRAIVSLDRYDESDQENENSLHETLVDEDQTSPEVSIVEEETKKRLVDAIKILPEREQLLLSLYYYEDLTFKEIGEILEVSESRVSQLHARATMSLRSILESQIIPLVDTNIEF